MVIDDDEDAAELCMFMLQQLGEYEVVVETDSTRAQTVISSVQPDLVLMDVQMPALDGFQVYDLLQGSDDTKHIPVVFVTGTINHPQFAQRGINGRVQKPYTGPELLAAVSNVLEAQTKRQEKG